MSAFAVVRSPEYLERLCRELTAYIAFQRQREVQPPDDLLGIWIEHETAQAGTALVSPVAAAEALPIVATTGVGGIWAICRTEAQRLTRERLLDVLMAKIACGPRCPGGSFLPVFGAQPSCGDYRVECRRLAARHPGRVRPPLVQRPDGSLSLTDVEWAEYLFDNDALPA